MRLATSILVGLALITLCGCGAARSRATDYSVRQVEAAFKANGLPLRRARFGPAPGIVELRHAGLEVDVDVKRKGTQSVTWYSGSTDAERSTATRNVIVTWPPRDTRSVETALRRLRSHV